jgi:hypothetical protein
VGSWDGDLVQRPGLTEFHELHRAWAVTLPPVETCLEAGILRVGSSVVLLLGDFACWDTRPAPGQRQPATTRDGKGSSG